jgi:hypothetical protein
MSDRPHALGGWNTSDGRTARRLTYRGKHRVFGCVLDLLAAGSRRVRPADECRVISGHEQRDEEGFQQILLVQLVSAVAEAPRRQCCRVDRASCSALPCFVGQTTCRNCGHSCSTCRRSAHPSLLHDGDTSPPSQSRPISPLLALPAHSIAGGSLSSNARLASFIRQTSSDGRGG